jgi:hypothetical protein
VERELRVESRLSGFREGPVLAVNIINIHLIWFGCCRYGLKVSDLLLRSIYNFNFDLRVDVYVASSTFKLKIKANSD